MRTNKQPETRRVVFEDVNGSGGEIVMSSPRDRMGSHIVAMEGRFDAKGGLTVYRLPKGDGGGAYEVAGINERHHPAEARRLASLIHQGRQGEVAARAGAYIVKYTDPVVGWFPAGEAEKHPHVELLLRDSYFNRGGKGAAAILQLALGVTVDGVVGPATRSSFAAALADHRGLADRITAARGVYERGKFPWKAQARDESSKFWKGLANRWAKTHDAAMELVV